MAKNEPVKSGRQLRDEAVVQVQKASAVWRSFADRALDEVAHDHHLLTTDEVWDLLASRGVPSPTEPRAMGPVMLKGVRRGVLRPTDQLRLSKMPQNHARPQRVYESLVQGQPAPQWPIEDQAKIGLRCPTIGCPQFGLATDRSLSPLYRSGRCPQHGAFMVRIESNDATT
jgi:hypothetical protein